MWYVVYSADVLYVYTPQFTDHVHGDPYGATHGRHASADSKSNLMEPHCNPGACSIHCFFQHGRQAGELPFWSGRLPLRESDACISQGTPTSLLALKAAVAEHTSPEIITQRIVEDRTRREQFKHQRTQCVSSTLQVA